MLVPDNREACKHYEHPVPIFGPAPSALLQGFSNLPSCEIHVVCCTKKPVTAPEKLADNIWYHSIVVPKTGWMSSLFLGCIRAVRSKLKTITPDIVHGQGTERDCAIEAVLSGFANVITIHGNMRAISRLNKEPIFSYNWMSALLEPLCLRCTRGVFCNSQYTRNLVDPIARSTWDVPNALRQEFFTTLPRAPIINSDPITILNIGTICPRKRQVELLDVVRRIVHRGLKARFIFVGEVPPLCSYSERFFASLEELKNNGTVEWIEHLETVELIDALDRSNALLHFPTEESFGLVIGEALSRRLPVFASNVGGIRDICAGFEDSSTLIEPHDFVLLEHYLIQFINAPFRASAKTAKVISDRYHPKIIASQHLQIYQMLLDSPC